MNPLNRINIYDWMIIALSIFSAAGIYTFGWQNTLPQVLIAVASANAFEAVANKIRGKEIRFSKSATITGLFVGQLLPLSAAFYLPIATAAIAIASKNLINIHRRHVFNPTLFSMLVVSLLFGVSASWWGSFAFPTEPFPMMSMAAVIVLGLIITIRQRRHDLVWPFIGAYLLFSFVVTMIFPSVTQLSVIIDVVTLYAVFFMLTEPKTSPLFRKARMAYGVLAAGVYVLLNIFLPDYNLIGMVLVANLLVQPLDRYLK